MTLKVLALTSYPVEAAATRFRLVELLPLLADAGIAVTVRPFLDSATFRTFYDRSAMTRTTLGLVQAAFRRVTDLGRAHHADVILVMREAMIVGPPVIEMLAQALGRCPLVLDLDDPTWIAYDSPIYGRFARRLKWPGKTLTLIDRADLVTCGSRHVARFVQARGRPTTLVPPVVNPDVFRPAPKRVSASLPVVGWVGTHSTFGYLQWIAPALATLARTHPFRLYVVGSGAGRLCVPGVEVERRAWDLSREPADFASLDIGLYPLDGNDPWAEGKSALKSVQYMASGVPFVASPVGAAAELGIQGSTHLLASDSSEWVSCLGRLIEDPSTRADMGSDGRRYALAHHTTAIGAELLAGALRHVAS